MIYQNLNQNYSLKIVDDNFKELVAKDMSMEDLIASLTTEITFLKSLYLTANKTIYVATTGSDTTGKGTSANPYKTWAKALSMIPKNQNGFDATLNIASGTYEENVLIQGFHGGALNIVLGGNVTVNRFYVEESQYIYMSSASPTVLTINTNITAPFTLTRSTNMQVYNVDFSITTSNTYNGLLIDNLSNIITAGVVTITGALNGIYISNHSEIFVETLAGSGNTTGIRGVRGSQISYGTKTISATTEKALAGGAIITNLITMP